MATSTITSFTAVSAGNLDDTAVVLVDDKLSATHKATIAQLRTQINTGAQAFTSDVNVAGIMNNAAFASGFAIGGLAGTRCIQWTGTAYSFLTAGGASAPIIIGALTLTGFGTGTGVASAGATDSGGTGFRVIRVPN
jgi:hypothetical protein